MQNGLRVSAGSKRAYSILAATLLLGGCLSGGSGGGNSGAPTARSSQAIDQPAADEPAAPPADEVPAATPNRAPLLSGKPPGSTKVGESYSFRPGASDPDGDSLAFSIRNKPRWASFNRTTGQLSGRPAAGDEGRYEGIRITASDGSASDSLTFSVTVTQIATAAVTLSWNPPASNTDGSALVDLAGYRIYYGNEPQDYDNRIEIDNPGVTTYVLENLTPGTYYFAATAVNANGVESEFSGETSARLN